MHLMIFLMFLRQDHNANLLYNSHIVLSSPYQMISIIFLDCNDSNGGAVYLKVNKSPLVDDCAFSGCHSSGQGGGIYVDVKSITIMNTCAYICTAATSGQFTYERSAYSLVTSTKSYMQYCSLVNCGNDYTKSQATIFDTGVFHNNDVNYSFNNNQIDGKLGIISTKNSHQIYYERLNFFDNTGNSVIYVDSLFALDISNEIKNFNIINCTYNMALITFKGNIDLKNFYVFNNIRESTSTDDVFALKDGLLGGSISYSGVNTDLNWNFGSASVNRDYEFVEIPISIRECPFTPTLQFTVSSDFTDSNIFTMSYIDTPSPTGTFTASSLPPVNKDMIRAKVSNLFGKYSTEDVIAVSTSISIILIIIAVILMIIYLRHKAKQRKLRNDSGEFSMSDTEFDSTSYSYYYTYESYYSDSSYTPETKFVRSITRGKTSRFNIHKIAPLDFNDPYSFAGHTL